MSIDEFQHRYIYPNVSAVRWTGSNREEILKFVRLVCMGEMGWDHEKPEEAVHFVEGIDSALTIQFDNGLEAEEGQWIVRLRTSASQWLEVSDDAVFGEILLPCGKGVAWT